MYKIILIAIMVLFSNTLYASYLGNGKYLVNYRYVNYAVSPDVGERSYSVLFSNKKVIKVLDVQKGKLILKEKAFGLNEVIDALVKSQKSVKIYKKSGKIYKIKPKNSPYYVVFIDKIQRVYNSSTQDLTAQKEKKLKSNYYKWLRKGIKSYTIRIQDSRFANIYPEGIELTVYNNKISQAKDIRTYQDASRYKSYFLTVNKLFGVAKWGIKDATISYNSKYGYPSLISLKNGITISAYNLKPL